MRFLYMNVSKWEPICPATSISECKITIFFCNNGFLSTKKSILILFSSSNSLLAYHTIGRTDAKTPLPDAGLRVCRCLWCGPGSRRRL